VSHVKVGAESLINPTHFLFVSGRVCVASEERGLGSQHTDDAYNMAHNDCLSPSLSTFAVLAVP